MSVNLFSLYFEICDRNWHRTYLLSSSEVFPQMTPLMVTNITHDKHDGREAFQSRKQHGHRHQTRKYSCKLELFHETGV